MGDFKALLDGSSTETSDTLAAIDFFIDQIIISINNDPKKKKNDEKKNDKTTTTSTTKNKSSDDNNNTLTIQYMTIDRTIASALIRLIRIDDDVRHRRNKNKVNGDDNGNHHRSTTTGDDDGTTGTATITDIAATLRLPWCWHSIRFYQCGGRHADVAVMSALYYTNTKLEIARCNFLDDTLYTLGMELRFATRNNMVTHLAIVEQVIDETAAIALGRGLAKNRVLQILSLRNTKMDHNTCIMPIANGLRENATNSVLRSVNLRFCKLRDEHLAMLIGALRSFSPSSPSSSSATTTLAELLLRGNFCREQGMHQVALLLTDPQCQLVTLDISRQYFVGQKRFPMETLANALSQNQSLQHLDLMSNSLSDSDITILTRGICRPNDKETAAMTTTMTTTTTALQHLILTGSNAFRSRGANDLLGLVQRNTTLQQVLIPIRYPRDIIVQEQIFFFTNWNKSGRRIVFSTMGSSSSLTNNTTTTTRPTNTNSSNTTVAIGLWPKILERINIVDWNKHNNNIQDTKRCSRHKNAMIPALIYVMLRNSPVLLEH